MSFGAITDRKGKFCLQPLYSRESLNRLPFFSVQESSGNCSIPFNSAECVCWFSWLLSPELVLRVSRNTDGIDTNHGISDPLNVPKRLSLLTHGAALRFGLKASVVQVIKKNLNNFPGG